MQTDEGVFNASALKTPSLSISADSACRREACRIISGVKVGERLPAATQTLHVLDLASTDARLEVPEPSLVTDDFSQSHLGDGGGELNRELDPVHLVVASRNLVVTLVQETGSHHHVIGVVL